mmetsp:Transcript_43700/g.103163  ORF Transcript_43700/g.103163 Transcript_43700/m.103163 type:complete len:114 (-) Transcript_43700:215-556(-)
MASTAIRSTVSKAVSSASAQPRVVFGRSCVQSSVLPKQAFVDGALQPNKLLQMRCGSGVPGAKEELTLDKFLKGPVPGLAALGGLMWYVNRDDGSGPRMHSVTTKLFGVNAPF